MTAGCLNPVEAADQPDASDLGHGEGSDSDESLLDMPAIKPPRALSDLAVLGLPVQELSNLANCSRPFPTDLSQVMDPVQLVQPSSPQPTDPIRLSLPPQVSCALFG